jgi:Ni/Co efflux regulator RcnB
MKMILLMASAAAVLAAPMLTSAQTPEEKKVERENAQARHDNAIVRHDDAIVHHDNGIVRHDRNVVRWDRTKRDWLVSRPEFHDFHGARPGFWYVPGHGYYRPDPRWYGFSWRVGFVAPFEFRTFYVQDPLFYGLAPAPYGFQYIYLNNNIALINLASGQIVSILPNIY